MAEPMDTDLAASGSAGTSSKPHKVDRLIEGRDAPWVEKYRPKTLDDVAAHKEIIDTIKKLTAENRLPHLLLYGPPGTGKTSTILAVARQIYGGAMQNMSLELNASDDRGIDVVREQIQDFAMIEKYTRNTRFCLICNYVSKIIPALQSRCTRFRFPPLHEQHVRDRLQHVISQENVKLGEGGMDALVRLGGGDMRRTLNILQVSHVGNAPLESGTSG
eukprot:gene11044-11199_t